jgi:hypothetical protein
MGREIHACVSRDFSHLPRASPLSPALAETWEQAEQDNGMVLNGYSGSAVGVQVWTHVAIRRYQLWKGKR